MDIDQRDYLFQMQQLRQMPPYGMMYPYPDLYMTEMESRRDLEYLQQMYPKDAKRMQKKVEEACDRLDYDGSMMYDEYPDRVSMLLICDRIITQLEQEDAIAQAQETSENRELQETQLPRHGAPPPPPPPPRDPARRSLLEVLLYNEMHRRRCKRRQCRRFW